MFAQSPFSLGIATGVVPAPQLMVGGAEALALIVLLLAVCCGLLWLLTGSTASAASAQLPGIKMHRTPSGTSATQRYRAGVRIGGPRPRHQAPSLAKAR